MSLYYEAAPLLDSSAEQLGSLQSRVFSAKNLKSKAPQLYALLVEATKWSDILSEVIQNAELLRHERKLSPSLALLLVHDLLISKRGIAAPVSHPLRVVVTKHKARLTAELTKARLKRGYPNLNELKAHIDEGSSCSKLSPKDLGDSNVADVLATGRWPRPRWVRINTLRASLEELLNTAFSTYQRVDSIEGLLIKSTGIDQFLHVDKHVPDLVAFFPKEDLTRTAAYRNGLIIFQDKASCFPAYLLEPLAEGRDAIDACAAPGNKTTHMAALMHNHGGKDKSRIFACERDKQRAQTLQSMVTLAGADKIVMVKAGQDFLRVDPIDPKWDNVGSILLDPSCSGSGIIGRDEELVATLPKIKDDIELNSKKRKRKAPKTKASLTTPSQDNQVIEEEEQPLKDPNARLEALSRIQLKLLLHAFRFPNATRVAYSTCSVHAQENECVVIKALLSPTAAERSWRILRRDEQVSGMAAWDIRGQESACDKILSECQESGTVVSSEEVVTACIRCEKGTKEGTQGFFVAAFVRGECPMTPLSTTPPSGEPCLEGVENHESEEGEWGGFSDNE